MRVEQAYTSNVIKKFRYRLFEKYGLRSYFDETQPAIFFGCYLRGNKDIKKILSHKSKCILVWRGSDSMRLHYRNYEPVLKSRNIIHVAISKFVSDDLTIKGISHHFLPITPSEPDKFLPAPLGDSVYMYASKARSSFYGENYLKQLRTLVKPIEIILMRPNSIPHEEMYDVYKRCFLGLRLLKHDGLSNSVVEMALMGRRSVWNGGLSTAIRWNNINDVARIIKQEHKKAGSEQQSVADMTRREILLPEDWLDLKYYSGVPTGKRRDIVIRVPCIRELTSHYTSLFMNNFRSISKRFKGYKTFIVSSKDLSFEAKRVNAVYSEEIPKTDKPKFILLVERK